LAALRLRPATWRYLQRADVTLSFLETETAMISRWRAARCLPHVSYFAGAVDWRWLRRDRSTVRVGISNTVAKYYEITHQLRCDGVVTPGVNQAWLREPVVFRPEARRLLYAGRLEGNKGVRILLSAFTLLAQEFPDLELRLAGRGPLRAELEQLATASGLASRVHFCGSLSHEALHNELRHADIFLFPTNYESFGIVALEAQSVGTPVVCSDLPALWEATGGHAEFVGAGDAQRWAETVAGLLVDRERRKQLATKGRSHASQLTWGHLTVELEKYLQLALDRVAAPAAPRTAGEP
jgi:glycosyltransferase involved in cell wall biosynthesis